MATTGSPNTVPHSDTARLLVINMLPRRGREAVARALLSLGSQGNVQTETLKAWNEDEFRRVVDSL